MASSSRQGLHVPYPIGPDDGREIRGFYPAHFDRVVLGPRHSSVPLQRQHVEPLGRKRQRHLYVHFVAAAGQPGGEFPGRREREPQLPSEIAGNGEDREAALRRTQHRAKQFHADRTKCSTRAESVLNAASSMSVSQARGRGSATSISASIFPFESTITRSARNTASLTSWVMKMTVGRRACQMRVSSSCRVIRVCASTLANGSSMSRMSGSFASARATPTRCCM